MVYELLYTVALAVECIYICNELTLGFKTHTVIQKTLYSTDSTVNVFMFVFLYVNKYVLYVIYSNLIIAEWTSTMCNNFIRFEILKNILANSYEYYQGTKTEECKLVQIEERHHLFFLIDQKYY